MNLLMPMSQHSSQIKGKVTFLNIFGNFMMLILAFLCVF